MKSATFIALLTAVSIARAEPLIAPGDLRLRHDLQLLSDSGVIDLSATAWPMSWGDVQFALDKAAATRTSDLAAVLTRIKRRASDELATDLPAFDLAISASLEPRFIRSFEETPREEGELRLRWNWTGERFAVNLAAAYVANPFDGDEFRPDGTYVGAALGNWMLTAGWQERWWGPGRDGSLILSTNARPSPGIALQRNVSKPFSSKWLRWIGPWTLSVFMTQLDDDRVVRNARLFGVRGSFRPPKTGLEIGISRTAQWCGDGRPCDLDTFADLLVGNDNRGVNVDPDDEPGNQLGGFDIRWRLPRQIPVALYMQWIGEDGRGGGGAIGSWLRQLGVEHWGTVGSLRHRTHFEVSDTTCRQGGFGFSVEAPNCAYNHSIYRTGYRYSGKAIGHPTDGDGLSYSVGSTLVQSGGHTWNISIRHMQINRFGSPDLRHTLSPTPFDRTDVQVSYNTLNAFGRFHAGLGYFRNEDSSLGSSESDVAAFLQWSNR